MRWKILGPLLGVLLLAAFVYALWPSAPVVPPVGSGVPDITDPMTVPTAPKLVVEKPLRRAGETAEHEPGTPSAQPEQQPGAAPVPGQGEPGVMAAQGSPTYSDPSIASEGLTGADAGLRPLTPEGIQGAMQDALGDISDCYENWLQQNPDLSGRMTMHFVVRAEGDSGVATIAVVEVIDGGLGHVAMEGCVGNVIHGLRFEPPAEGETSVNYPFSFSTNINASPP